MLLATVTGELMMTFIISWFFFLFLKDYPSQRWSLLPSNKFMLVPSLHCRFSQEQSLVLLDMPLCRQGLSQRCILSDFTWLSSGTQNSDRSYSLKKEIFSRLNAVPPSFPVQNSVFQSSSMPPKLHFSICCFLRQTIMMLSSSWPYSC